MSTTLNDIAQRAGLSVSTVSRVLNKKSADHRFRSETAELVLKTAAELNYKPNELARGLRLKKTNTIGLVVPDISNPFFSYITRSIQRKVHDLGFSLVVCDTDEDINQELEHIDLLTGKGVDGLIVLPVGLRFDHLKSLYEKGIPIVLLDRCFDEFPTNSVIVDNYQGAYEAVQHLIDFGHKRIALIQGLPHTYTANKRLRGYRDALADHDLPIDESLIVGDDFRQQNGYIETKFLLRVKNPPTAIFATSDLITLGALQAIFEEKLHIPKDVSIVSFDDVDFAPYLISPLTAVSQPRDLMGEIAVKMLMEQIENQTSSNEPKRIVLKPKLLVRGSVRNLGQRQRQAAATDYATEILDLAQ